MIEIKIEGNKPTLYQWDLNMRVVLTNVPAGTEVHYSSTNKNNDEYCITVISYSENNCIYANIPNKILQTSGIVLVYIYVRNEDKAWTEFKTEIFVIPRKKPANYVYTETEVKTFESLEKRIESLEKDAARQNVLVGSKMGNSIVIDDAFAASLYEMTIYGRSKQMATAGAQLLDLSDLIGKTETKNGATYKINEDQSVSVSGTPTGYTSFSLKRMSLKAGSYCFINNSSSNNVFIQLLGTNVNMSGGFTLDEDFDEIDVYIVFNVASNNTESFNMTFTSMLNAGDTALPWEPYTGGKPSPSPDYPQEIKSVVNPIVKVYGKNMMPYPKDNTVRANGVTLTAKDGKYTLVGKPTENTWMNIYPQVVNYTESSMLSEKPLPTKGKKISMINGSVGYSLNFRKVSNRDKVFGIEHNNAKLADEDSNGVFLYIFNIDKTYNDTFELMISDPADTTSTVFEPYTEQEVSLPYTLNAIPVPSGGNYTDENGQQWICDEVNLERGVYVQRVKAKELSHDAKWVYRKLASGNNNFQMRIYGEDASKNSFPSICNILPYKNVIWDDNIQNLPKIYANNQEITASFPPSSEYSSLEAFKQLLTNVKSFIFYCLATPIETPLTPDEIAAYKTLHTYARITNISNDAEAWMQVGYQRDINIVIKNLEDAIASTTTV